MEKCRTIDPLFKEEEKRVISQEIAELNAKTVLRLSPRINEPDYIFVERGTDGCYSALGFMGGRQVISLEPVCMETPVTVIHEFCHAGGLNHEHQRRDRKQYIRVNFENVKKDELEQFTEEASYGEQLPYDYCSIMHYD
jgi:hypothetical protein